MKTKKAILLALLLSAGALITQSFINKETLSRKGDDSAFDINDYTWLAGHWEGDGFGGVSEEVWALPADGTMMGMYRHLQEDKLVFYEFLLLDKEGLRLKHFHPDLKGWESKDDFVTFPMVEYTKNKLVLKGLTFERKSDSEMEIRLRIRRGDKVETEVFQMKRK